MQNAYRKLPLLLPQLSPREPCSDDSNYSNRNSDNDSSTKHGDVRGVMDMPGEAGKSVVVSRVGVLKGIQETQVEQE